MENPTSTTNAMNKNRKWEEEKIEWNHNNNIIIKLDIRLIIGHNSVHKNVETANKNSKITKRRKTCTRKS